MKTLSSLNYQAYLFASGMKTACLRRVPKFLVKQKKDLSRNIQISITTYIDRYESHFKPLYLELSRIFPDINVHVAVNGFFDKDSQQQFLKKLHKELCIGLREGNTFILHDKAVGLTRLWNELINQGSCETILMLNDDLKIFPLFRSWLEKEAWGSTITLINGTWSHFFISRNIIKQIGWFDENFHGIGFEDMDYTARCSLGQIEITNLKCRYIQHQDHQPLRTSFDNQSKTLWGPKYSVMNHDAFFKKWRLSNSNTGVYIKQINKYVEPINQIRGKREVCNIHFNDGVAYPDRQ